MARMPVQFRLNGSDRAVFVEPAETLLGTIRRGLGDFAPKFGCGQGTCGVCTVLVDGEPRLGCLTLSVTCEGRSIETASGLADGPTLHPLQAAFMEHFAAQCGFCTPGMLMAAKALLAFADDVEIVVALVGEQILAKLQHRDLLRRGGRRAAARRPEWR